MVHISFSRAFPSYPAKIHSLLSKTAAPCADLGTGVLPIYFHSTHWPEWNLYSNKSFLFVKLELECMSPVYPPKTNIEELCTTAEWWYLGAGGTPLEIALPDQSENYNKDKNRNATLTPGHLLDIEPQQIVQHALAVVAAEHVYRILVRDHGVLAAPVKEKCFSEFVFSMSVAGRCTWRRRTRRTLSCAAIGAPSPRAWTLAWGRRRRCSRPTARWCRSFSGGRAAWGVGVKCGPVWKLHRRDLLWECPA